jgi:hypothetical protein
VQINPDQINYVKPVQLALPNGELIVGTQINVGAAGINLNVQNTIADINASLPSTLIAFFPTQIATPTYPAVIGSSQTDPYKLIDRRYFENWTQHNSPDGMSNFFFLKEVKFFPAFILQSWANYITDLPPAGPQGMMDTNNYNLVSLGIPM